MRLLYIMLLALVIGIPNAKAQGTSVSNSVIEITADKPEDEDTGSIVTEGDDFEDFNRGVFAFNEGLDDVVLEPIARGYRAVVPKYGRERVRDFFGNLGEPVTFLNSLLQGDVDNAIQTFWRFFVNTTLGAGGLFDHAQYTNLQPRQEDFGQTLGRHGTESGSYLVLPVFGPSTSRDTVGLVFDALTNPFNYLSGGVTLAFNIGEGITEREELLDLTDEIEKTSFDPYATYRSAYLQRRMDLINNGEGK